MPTPPKKWYYGARRRQPFVDKARNSSWPTLQLKIDAQTLRWCVRSVVDVGTEWSRDEGVEVTANRAVPHHIQSDLVYIAFDVYC